MTHGRPGETGAFLEAGKGIGADPVRAQNLYAQVCQTGPKASCERAQRLGGDGMTRSASQADWHFVPSRQSFERQ
jgi:TPR repeat protein